MLKLVVDENLMMMENLLLRIDYLMMEITTQGSLMTKMMGDFSLVVAFAAVLHKQ